jgi:hypothetical protein
MSAKRDRAEERPPAPWGKFPLAELTILAGIILLIVGFISGSPTALGLGIVLGALGGLEVSIREHFAGYRSHSTLLAGTVFVVVTAGLLYLSGLVLAICLGAGVVAFAAAFLALRAAFRRASGGLSYRVGGLRG